MLRWHLRREAFSKAPGITRTSHSDKKAAPGFFSGAAVIIALELLWPWWWRLFRWLLLSTLRLVWGTLTRSAHSRSRRPAGLIKARTWLSRATRFARRSARRRRRDRTMQPRWCPRFPAATLSCSHVTWRRSAEALTFKWLAAILRRNILITTCRTRTLAQPARCWSTMFRWWRRLTERGWRWRSRCSSRVGCRARERRSPAWSTFAAFKWRRRQACWSRRRCRDSGSWPSTWRWFSSLKWCRRTTWCSCCRAWKHSSGFTSWARRNRRPCPACSRTLADAG